MSSGIIKQLSSALLLLFLVFASIGSAQEGTGELSGIARDPSGAVIPKVNINITNKSSGRVVTSETGTNGAYVIRALEPGRYSVRFEVQGFNPLEYPDVIVVAGRVLTLNPGMTLRSTQEVIEVTAQATLIDTTTTAVGHNVTQEEFSRLPKTRSFQSIANIMPSVNAGPVVEGGIQINGASGSENLFSVDGLSTNSLIQGHSRQNVSFEILEEVQVKTSGIEAQYGGALGGVISAITRTGGNRFTGEVHYFLSGNKLSAGPVKRLLMDPTDLLTVSYVNDSKDINNRHEIGYSLGGYLVKNRVFFFSGASPQFQYRERNYFDVGNSPVTLTSDAKYWQAYNKITADITNNVRANAGFLWTPSSQDGIIVGYTGYRDQMTDSASSLLANQNRGWFSPQSNYNGNIDWTITPTMLLSVKAARFWDNYKALGVRNVSAIQWGKPSTGIEGLAPELQQPQGYSTTPRVPTNLFDIATRTLFQADMAKLVSFRGIHDLKFGIGRQKNVNKVDNSYPGGGFITLHWDSSLALPDGNYTRGNYGYYQLDDVGTKGSTGGTLDHIYIQDRWRINHRLSLDLGVRFEREIIPSFRRDIKEYAFEFGWGDKIAPRLGGSYDIFGDGRLKVYASYGIFYDWVKYDLARGTFGGIVWRVYYRALDTLDPNVILNLGNGNLPGRNLWVDTFEDKRIPAFDETQVDPDIRPMSSWIVNSGVEWQLNSQFVLAARYTRNQLRETIEDIGTMINGSEYYIYGNPGRGIAKMSRPIGLSPAVEYTRPKRIYDAFELSFTRRFANRWFASGSYVLSRLYGNYAGLQNSDQVIPAGTGGAALPTQQSSGVAYSPGSSATRAYDLAYYSYDSRGNLVEGRLGSDRPHVFKLYGSYTLPSKAGDTELGAIFFAKSGTPVSTYVQDVQYVPLFVNGRGDMGRTPVWTQTDLLVAHVIRIGEGKSLRFEFNAENLFNQQTSLLTYSYLNRYRIRSSGINLFQLDFRNGYDYNALLAASDDAKKPTGALDPRYNHPDNFNPGFAGRFGIKFIF